jgi:hypothetical protein
MSQETKQFKHLLDTYKFAVASMYFYDIAKRRCDPTIVRIDKRIGRGFGELLARISGLVLYAHGTVRESGAEGGVTRFSFGRR